ncbi:hypothetical protein SAMN05428988_0359 [Chitinophaga sp. YR573]|uniref:hypothetical protein n=1 Tax=Chitinophaga sp. YR573 TaxID=1881040 RepID=UPI0008C4A124|nr:hypothetical protein [Chitinophaga sp. YR573]SEV91016.1 hypothetical protein SAMN05428988_0359 [Chitinophaga sp. YR573]
MNDNEIQSLLDGELIPDSLSDNEKRTLEQYQLLIAKLEEEPHEGLSYSFASKVKARLQAQINRKKDIRFYSAAFIFLILGFATFYGLLLFVNANAGNEFVGILSKFKWIIVLGAVLFVGILYLDQKLVKERILNQR